MEKNGLYPMEYLVNLFCQLNRFIFIVSVFSATKSFAQSYQSSFSYDKMGT
jgi:hypothetical protein